MVKNKINVIISNLKLIIFISKIGSDIIKFFSILTIINKYARSVSILQFSFSVSANNIDITTYFSYLEIENLDENNKSNKNEIKIKIQLNNKINQDEFIYKINRASN